VQLFAVSLSPDEWMTQLGVELGHSLREPLSDHLWRLGQELLANGQNVIMESGHWMRGERNEKRLVARALGVTVELQYLDELHRRIAKRTTERTWGSYPTTPHQLDGWATLFQPPDASELALFDAPTKLAEPSID
jgi:predicted kinase